MAGQATQFSISPSAYALLVLHAARHPQNAVTGFLLGTVEGSNATVEKVVPLAHHWNSLAAAEDMALALIDAHLSAPSPSAKSPPLTILGIYEAPSRVNATGISTSAVRLAGKVAKLQAGSGGKAGGSSAGPALAVLVQNAQLLTPSTHALQPYLVPASSSPAPQSRDAKSLTLQGAYSTIAELTKLVREKGAWKDVRDFDDHMEDARIDWLDNSQVQWHLQGISVLAA